MDRQPRITSSFSALAANPPNFELLKDILIVKNIVLPVVLLTVVFSIHSVPSQADGLGGASAPRVDMKLRRDWQYKRVHQIALRYILLKKYKEAAKYLNDFIKDYPDDAESRYALGVLYAQQGELKKSEGAFREAIELGLPSGRILAGPRSLMKPLANQAFYSELLEEHTTKPVHGPLVGVTTNSSASIWVRTAGESPVTLVLFDAKTPREELEFGPVISTEESDLTAVLRADDLQPQTKYEYGIRIGDGEVLRDPQWWFETFPKMGQASKFSLAFGGGAGFVPDNEHMWNTIGSFHPNALLLLGDNVYIDDPESPEMQQYTYYRRQSRAEWRDLTSHTSVFTIWDDHDFSTNDSWGGPMIDKPHWKQDSVWPIFRQNWANPDYAGGDEYPGCWYNFSIGDVDFFMLDCRYYRTNPRSESASMLGPVQLAWLKKQLGASKGTFKVVCSSVPWDFRTKGDSFDTWNGYKAEREVIFSFIEQQGIEGVVLLSADRHRTDAWQIERPEGYDFFEFNSSRLTNLHVHPTMEKEGALFSYNKKQSFGLVSFDTTEADPTVVYDIVSIDREKVYSLEVKRSQLQRK